MDESNKRTPKWVQIENEMTDYIIKYNITEYFQFALICRHNHPMWYRRLRTNSLHFSALIRSQRHSLHEKERGKK